MMEIVTEELAGEHRLFGRKDCDKTFITVFFQIQYKYFVKK